VRTDGQTNGASLIGDTITETPRSSIGLSAPNCLKIKVSMENYLRMHPVKKSYSRTIGYKQTNVNSILYWHILITHQFPTWW
jgi:hypothetical protein